jgi:hypothetical protein
MKPQYEELKITQKEIQSYSSALSDFLCWIDGFEAAGGKYSPGSKEEIRTLSIKLKDLWRYTNEKTP